MSGADVSNAKAWARAASEHAKKAKEEDPAISASALVSIALSLSVIAGVVEQCTPARGLIFPEVPDQSGEDPPPHPDDNRMRDEVRDLGVLQTHQPEPNSGPFIGCTCGWSLPAGSNSDGGPEWVAHILSVVV